ncbi:MAG: GNAT family N-acetyltransferase [Spirochaetia bacterium]|nr:GNAT family N-acetyltransferase [Spirochaetia bacterium]
MTASFLPSSLLDFSPRLHIEIRRHRYTVKSVENVRELEDVLKLRHEVYYGELLGRRVQEGIDTDAFDAVCDHMMIAENDSGRVVGTYRLNASAFNKRFYSQKEFRIDRILALPGGKLEIGRACIHRDFRNGAVFSLLWRGVLEYRNRVGARYLFGCSSIPVTDPVKGAAIHRYLWEKYPAPPDRRVEPRFFRRLPGFSRLRKFFQKKSVSEIVELASREVGANEPLMNLVSELLLFYLRAGAVICGPPALDRAFRCIDFFTLIDLEQVGERARRHFRIA